jgi:hypothetical protein
MVEVEEEVIAIRTYTILALSHTICYTGRSRFLILGLWQKRSSDSMS